MSVRLHDSDGQTVEQMLTPAIQRDGLATVLEHLAILFRQVKPLWSDYQRVENIARNIARKLERKL